MWWVKLTACLFVFIANSYRIVSYYIVVTIHVPHSIFTHCSLPW